jgi:hypothetical protein
MRDQLLGASLVMALIAFPVATHAQSGAATGPVVGAKLPTSGVTYYEVPQEYRVAKYRYTVVNERPVLVDPGTHTIVQVID